MSHVTKELFAILVWVDILLVTGVFLYLVYSLRDAGGIRFELAGGEGAPGANRETPSGREAESPEREEETDQR